MIDPNAKYNSLHLVAPEFARELEAFPVLPLSDDFIAFLRQGGGLDHGFLDTEVPDDLVEIGCEEVFIPGPVGAPDVRLLVYTPPREADAARPALLHIHGGGYILGTPEINDLSNRRTVLEHDCVVASVDYRLAPETRWPGAVEDCYAALRWLHENAGSLKIDTARIAIAGESAGGGHAAALALLARDRGEFPICFQLLDSPMLDDRTSGASDPHPYTGELTWTRDQNAFGWRALLGVEPGGSDVPAKAVPARAENLAGLPATCIAVGALDLFLEECMEYARRLSRAGVPIELLVTPGAFHGAGMSRVDTPLVATKMRVKREALARAFNPPPIG